MRDRWIIEIGMFSQCSRRSSIRLNGTILKLIQWRPSRPRNPPLQQTNHRRNARLRRRCWHDHDPTCCHQVTSHLQTTKALLTKSTHRIAHATSKYGFVFARRGITMESCSAYFLPRLIGYSKALYLVSTGAVLPSASPHFGGLFAETLTEQSEVLPRALALATDIAENTSTMANGLNRALIWRGPESAEEAHLLDSPVLYHMFGSRYVDSKLFDSGILLGGEAYWGFCRDNKEGVMSFFEKRKPNFKDTLVDNGPAIYPWWTEADISRKPKVVKGDSKL